MTISILLHAILTSILFGMGIFFLDIVRKEIINEDLLESIAASLVLCPVSIALFYLGIKIWFV